MVGFAGLAVKTAGGPSGFGVAWEIECSVVSVVMGSSLYSIPGGGGMGLEEELLAMVARGTLV